MIPYPVAVTVTASASVGPTTRTVAYTYDGLRRLTGATESPGSNFAYSYDLAGNRTGVTVNGTATLTDTYDAADQVVGWTYDGAGNLISDGTTSYGYNATNDLTGTTTTGQSHAYVYNGDGTLVAQTANGTTTTYTQDLAADQSQILAATIGVTTTDYLYGQDIAPLAALTGGIRTWYGIDGQGSVRQSLNDTGTVLGVRNYDPFGQIEAGASLTGPFGYTGELQDGVTGQEYLRARWYQPGNAQLLGVDPDLASTGQPYSYAYNDPINGSDPSGLDCGFLTFLQGNCRLPTPQEAASTWRNEVRPETYSAAVSVAGFYDSATSGAFSLLTDLAGVYIPQDCEADYQEGEDFGLAYNVIESLLSGGTDEAADASLAARFPRILGIVEDAGENVERLAPLVVRLERLKKLDGAAAYQPELADIDEDLTFLANASQEELDAFLPDVESKLKTLETNTGSGLGTTPTTLPEGSPQSAPLEYESSPKHHENAGPGIGDAPENGQAALDDSVQVKATSTRRVGVDPAAGQIVVFDETTENVFHGHVRTWDQLDQQMKNALQPAGLVDRKGRVKT